jgi:hypothetical protein
MKDLEGSHQVNREDSSYYGEVKSRKNYVVSLALGDSGSVFSSHSHLLVHPKLVGLEKRCKPVI